MQGSFWTKSLERMVMKKDKENEGDETQGQQYVCVHTPIIVTPEDYRTLDHRMAMIGNMILCYFVLQGNRNNGSERYISSRTRTWVLTLTVVKKKGSIGGIR